MRARMPGPAFQPREEVFAEKKAKKYRQTHDPGSDRQGAKSVVRVLGKIRRAIPRITLAPADQTRASAEKVGRRLN